MKRRSLFILGILIIGSAILFNHIRLYSTSENNLEDNIKGFINRPTIITDKIDIKQAIDIGNKKYVLFRYNENLCEAELIRGLNGKYKIESTNGGSDLFQYRVREINKSKYFVLSGKNHDLKIDNVKVILDGNKYEIAIPQQEYFIAYCAVSNNTQSVFPENGFRLFDNNNIEITNDI